MSRITGEMVDPFADVRLEKVSVGGDEVNKVAVRVQDSNGQYQLAGILGENYNLIKNSIARDISHDIMSRSNMEWTGLKTLWDGKKYIDYFYSSNALTTITNGKEYPLHLGMLVRNSYDGSSMFGLEFYVMNMICKNQYIARKAMGYYSIRHTDGGKYDIDDAVQNISVSGQRLIEIAPRYQAMTKIPLQISDLTMAREKDLIPKSNWGDVLENLGKEDNIGTVFGLYQALTFVTSHVLNGIGSIKKSNDVTEHFFDVYRGM